MPLDEIQFEAEEHMDKALEHLQHEFRGLRTGRATTALVEYVKVNYYGTPTDLRALATITTPDASSIMIKPFDPSSLKDVVRGLEEANLGINPQSDGKQVRMVLPALSGERRKQLAGKVKEVSEHEKKDSLLTEDEAKRGQDEIQELLKKFETRVDEAVATKTKEIMDS